MMVDDVDEDDDGDDDDALVGTDTTTTTKHLINALLIGHIISTYVGWIFAISFLHLFIHLFIYFLVTYHFCILIILIND